MQDLAERIAKANLLLAPYAVRHEGEMGRKYVEEEDESRTPFQRDRDRIIHTQAFRRLKGKTQVFVTGEGDHYRTRLTHTIEVAQISRDIARALAVNEDLAESIALAHDLGHPPFGHAGEQALDDWLRRKGKRFEHNAQSLRIVTQLEEHSSLYKGLNLNREILQGLQKHVTPHDVPLASDPSIRAGMTIEAQIVNLADEIAYTGHDTEDGLRAGLFSLKEIRKVSLGRDAWEFAEPRGTSLRGALIHFVVRDLYRETDTLLKQQNIKSLGDVLSTRDPLVTFSEPMRKHLSEIRAFLTENMYCKGVMLAANNEGQKILMELCEYLEKDPPEKVCALMKKFDATLEESIKDYVAGMTDAYATDYLENDAMSQRTKRMIIP